MTVQKDTMTSKKFLKLSSEERIKAFGAFLEVLNKLGVPATKMTSAYRAVAMAQFIVSTSKIMNNLEQDMFSPFPVTSFDDQPIGGMKSLLDQFKIED